MADLAPFADAADLAAYTQGKISQTDPRVDGALEGASAAIRRYCGWHIYPELTETIRVDGPGGPLLSLPTLHLVELGITESGRTLTDDTDFQWSTDGSVRRAGCWTDDFRAVTAVMKHGYDEVPDLQQVVLAVVSRLLSSPMGATREQAGAVSISWATTAPGVSGGLALLGHEYTLLDPYRIVSV